VIEDAIPAEELEEREQRDLGIEHAALRVADARNPGVDPWIPERWITRQPALGDESIDRIEEDSLIGEIGVARAAERWTKAAGPWPCRRRGGSGRGGRSLGRWATR
jgi:hypothetical protein